MATAAETKTETAQYITFRLGDELFAVNVANVREVLDVTPVTRVPTAPPYLRGVVNVRGKAIPVVDLRTRFGLPNAAETVHTRILVLELTLDGESVVVGGQADSVREVVDIDGADIGPGPRIGSRWRSEMVRGMARRGDEFVLILDVSRILDVDDLAATQAAAA